MDFAQEVSSDICVVYEDIVATKSRIFPCTQVCMRTYQGHMNEKNFVGLSAHEEFIACGSEQNEASSSDRTEVR